MRPSRLLCCALALTAACTKSITPTQPLTLVNGWFSVEFVIVDSTNAVIDVYQAGGYLALSLNSDSTVLGALHVPASVNGGSILDADMAGTFSTHGDSVFFHQAADTFVRDMPFIFDPHQGSLAGTETFGKTTVHVRLITQSL